MNKKDSHYDKTKIESIKKYSERLVNSTLKKKSEIEPITDKDSEIKSGAKSKGKFGQILEKNYFGLESSNEPRPDFNEVGLELKSFPLIKRASGKISAKERLVLNKINYKEEAKKSFKESSFLKKSKKILLISYFYEKEKPVVDFIINGSDLINFYELPKNDRLIIEKDWKKINNKIKKGEAHLLSEGDTNYLCSCTKAATAADLTEQFIKDAPKAKPRAFSFKGSYILSLIIADPKLKPAVKEKELSTGKSIEEIIKSKFDKYIGKDLNEIANKVGYDLNNRTKNKYATLTKRILGTNGGEIEEFVKAGIEIKTIQLKSNGNVKEHISFPTFKYEEIIKESWEDDGKKPQSEFHKKVVKKIFFVVVECSNNCGTKDKRILKKVCFWNMPVEDIEETRKVWVKTIQQIIKLMICQRHS